MQHLDPVKKVKGMLFAGCSFTWGQGLYYYSGLQSVIEPPPNSYDHELVNDSHIDYMKSVRFPRIVADHFNSFEICQPWNGGASYSIHDWWRRSFTPKNNPKRSENSNHKFPIPYYDFEDVGCVIYQFTQWHRGQSSYRPQKWPITHCDAMQEPGFKTWLDSNNLTFDSYRELAIKKEIEYVKEFLKMFTDVGIKVYVLSWPRDYNDNILNDPWFLNKFITLNYKNKNYLSIEDMTEDQDEHGNILSPELIISRDRENFKIPPEDHHPSKKCHRVIADSIIKHLEKEKQ